jgi:hypothetical protein
MTTANAPTLDRLARLAALAAYRQARRRAAPAPKGNVNVQA